MSSIGFLDQAVSLHGLQHQFTVMMKEIRKYGMVCLSLLLSPQPCLFMSMSLLPL